MEAHLGGVDIDTSGLISRIAVDVGGFRSSAQREEGDEDEVMSARKEADVRVEWWYLYITKNNDFVKKNPLIPEV
jgi:hypothetical protein